ncbi:enkurin domain-containing protein 1 [Lethenteron reissneri]|uniref:enkurin domain-containing protein 1 n=1 Tax=Lethenteron reissneri TaxID=7753 RepID=UPI002AB78C3F|nr:enkurin domain-containing protein 1 [Lethenteron reissneri]
MCEGPSTISGPIPPDLSLYPKSYNQQQQQGRPQSARNPIRALPPWVPSSARSPAPGPPPPRALGEGLEILLRGRGSVGALIHAEGPRQGEGPWGGGPKRQGHKPRNHVLENLRRIRKIQQQHQQHQQQPPAHQQCEATALWKSRKYDNVPSKVTAKLQEPPLPPRAQSAGFLRAHSRGRGESGGETPRQARQSVDFVKRNARDAWQRGERDNGLSRSNSQPNLSLAPQPKGMLPAYLIERREEWSRQQEERRRQQPEIGQPEGHTAMRETERAETLACLRSTQQQLLHELGSMPMRADTLRVRERRADIERRLAEVEEAVRIFSRERVYVKRDS